MDGWMDRYMHTWYKASAFYSLALRLFRLPMLAVRSFSMCLSCFISFSLHLSLTHTRLLSLLQLDEKIEPQITSLAKKVGAPLLSSP